VEMNHGDAVVAQAGAALEQAVDPRVLTSAAVGSSRTSTDAFVRSAR